MAAGGGDGSRLRHPSPVRRDLLRQAAREVILRVGVSKATVREIAAAGGVSVGTLTYHYGSVDEILDDVLHHESVQFTETIVDRMREQQSPTTRLRLLTESFIGNEPELVEY